MTVSSQAPLLSLFPRTLSHSRYLTALPIRRRVSIFYQSLPVTAVARSHLVPPLKRISVHSAAFISIKTFGPKPFKFFNVWSDHKDFLSWVEEAWATEIGGSPMFTLSKKLKAVKAKLRAVTDDEVKGSMFSLGSEKAPGPDGFTTHFFKNAWSLLEEMFAYQ
uniref:Uncharacterized protein n=1 Tax=Fagus sylvatica TaxID=28930 RepID=A0A2N9IPI3_FAGSY